MSRYLFTSESVSEGHPDKVADRISDEVLDELLRASPRARGAVETLVLANFCLVSGEIGGADVDAEAAARRAIAAIGYRGAGFDANTVEVHLRIQQQSPEIAAAVGDEGAGDQGLMFGFACHETPALMPAAIYYAHQIVERLAELRRGGAPLGPDGKSQVTIEYDGYVPRRVHTVVVSHQHHRDIGGNDLRAIIEPVLAQVFPEGWVDERTRILINPSGSFVLGGPAADTGLTGRKIIVDTYGGAAPHGGGAFSGKDPTKVDRSAAYGARWLAKNVVAAGLAERCLIQLSYAIGVVEPLAIYVDTSGTATVNEHRIVAAIASLGSLSQKWFRDRLSLDRPIYAVTSSYGHFGREPRTDGSFSWERLNVVEELLAAAGLESVQRREPLCVTVGSSAVAPSTRSPKPRQTSPYCAQPLSITRADRSGPKVHPPTSREQPWSSMGPARSRHHDEERVHRSSIPTPQRVLTTLCGVVTTLTMNRWKP